MTDINLFTNTSPFDAIRRFDESGEYWTARDLMDLLGYDRWESFEDAIDRAKVSLDKNSTDTTSDQAFSGLSEKATGGRPRKDYRLTRPGAYALAMNSDIRKAQVADAQAYFFVQTRRAETATAVFDMNALDIADPQFVILLAQAAQQSAHQAIEERALRQVAEAELAEVAPKAEAWDTLASADGDFAVADAAKVLSRDPNIRLGRDRLFTYLSELGWIHRQRGDQRWRVYQAQIDTGRMSEIPASHYHPRTGELILDPPQIRVTAKGLQELHRRLGGGSTGLAIAS